MPESGAHQGRFGAAGLIFLRKEGSALGGRDAEDAEIFLGNVDALYLLGAVSGAKIQAGAREIVNGHGVEGLVVILPGHELRNGGGR